MRLIRYKPEYLEPMLALHRSAMHGFNTGISQQVEESDLRATEKEYLQNGGEFLIGLFNGAVIAMGGYQRLPGNIGELHRMRIRKDFQDQGYGSRLLQELELRALHSGINKFIVQTAKARPLTLEFYRKHGYQETGSGFYGEVETLHFSKTIIEKPLK